MSRHDDRDQEARIAELRQQVERRAGGTIAAWESEMLSEDEREEFWRQVLEYEDSEATTSDFERLVEDGLDLPAPEAKDDEQLTTRLWEVIRALARSSAAVGQPASANRNQASGLIPMQNRREDRPASRLLVSYGRAAVYSCRSTRLARW